MVAARRPLETVKAPVTLKWFDSSEALEPVETDVVAGQLHALAPLERGLGLHRPGLRARHAHGDHQDAQVNDEAAVAAVLAVQEPATSA